MVIEQIVIVLNFPNLGAFFDKVGEKIQEKLENIEIIPPTIVGTFTIAEIKIIFKEDGSVATLTPENISISIPVNDENMELINLKTEIYLDKISEILESLNINSLSRVGYLVIFKELWEVFKPKVERIKKKIAPDTKDKYLSLRLFRFIENNPLLKTIIIPNFILEYQFPSDSTEPNYINIIIDIATRPNPTGICETGKIKEVINSLKEIAINTYKEKENLIKG